METVPCKNSTAGSYIKKCVKEGKSCQTATVISKATELFNIDPTFRTAWLNYVKIGDLEQKKEKVNSLFTFQRNGVAHKEAIRTYETRLKEYESGVAVGVNNFATQYALEQITSLIESRPILSIIDALGIFKIQKNKSGQWKSFSPTKNNTAGCKWATDNYNFREHVILLVIEQEETHKPKGGKKSRRGRMRKARRSTRRN